MTGKKIKAYDLCVLGCGAGGFAAAIRAVDLGKRVCVVENGQIGGAAVMWGALASKTFWELAKDYAIASKKIAAIGPGNCRSVFLRSETRSSGQ
ncbi:FAD-dependent oxidoreductase [Thermodesulfobacteriota bacterium]